MPEGLGTARFTKPLKLKKRRSARCPRVAALVQLHPPQNHRPGQLGAHTALGIIQQVFIRVHLEVKSVFKIDTSAAADTEITATISTGIFLSVL